MQHRIPTTDGISSTTTPQSTDIPAESSGKNSSEPLYVAAIGVSAGGLNALENLFKKIPSDSGAAFVVIQHLSPDHKSIMDVLLARHTCMPIKIVVQDMLLEPNMVYLIPSDAILQLNGNRFSLTPKPPHKINLPIDVFFQSLAANFKEKSIGIILSGTGSDGSRGAGAINEAGGLLIAQEPENAQFDGMPRSIISTGLVDIILPIELIAERIYKHVTSEERFRLSEPAESIEAIDNQSQTAYSEILQLLNHASSINFIDYKPGTLFRRIERRMAVRQIHQLEQYHKLLTEDEVEIQTILRELFIPVTRFFRDPDAFDSLKRQIIESILTPKNSSQEVRIWCAGISTGEEVYSIGMLFLEAFEQYKKWPSLKIFATDISQKNIDAASAGIYPESIAMELSPERMAKFFFKRGTQYEVKSELRQCIVFARHNLLVHPPFTKIDLVVCRNVLIYFKPDAQLRVLRRLQFSLKPGSLLFLGSSETLGPLQNDFHTLSQRHKIWKVIKPNTQSIELDSNQSFSTNTPTLTIKKIDKSSVWKRDHQKSNFIQKGYDTLLNAYAPPAAILINSNKELLHSYGNVSKFLHFRAGYASLEINRILPAPLVPVASALLYKTFREQKSSTSNIIRFSLENNFTSEPPTSEKISVRLSTWPVPNTEDSEIERQMTLLIFEEINAPNQENNSPIDVQLENTEHMEILQHELAATRESLQATIEELETANEELQATNEEMMASNEELQSSNEELQSVNEELTTLNSEYQEKIDILNRVNADLDNLAKAVASGTIFIDESLNITRFSPDATEIFKLRNTDIGRPLSDISHNLDYPKFMPDLLQSIKSSTIIEKEIKSSDGKIYIVKMLPYQVSSPANKGLVINFIDISSIHQVNRTQEILDASLSKLAITSEEGNIIFCNTAWREDVQSDNANGKSLTISNGDNYFKHLEKSQDPDLGKINQDLQLIRSGIKDSTLFRLPNKKTIVFSAKRLVQKNNILIEFMHEENLPR